MAAASTAVRPIGHEDRLSLVEHLDELRTRLIVCVATLVVAFAICAWQNKRAAGLHRQAAGDADRAAHRGGEGPAAAGSTPRTRARGRRCESNVVLLAGAWATTRASSPALRAVALQQAATTRRRCAPAEGAAAEPAGDARRSASRSRRRSRSPRTSRCCSRCRFILYQLYAFILPAFSPQRAPRGLPLMAMVPVLFIAGVAFGYVVVLPAATKFLQNFNADQFNVLVQAQRLLQVRRRARWSRSGWCSSSRSGSSPRRGSGSSASRSSGPARRYAIVATAVLAMILPGDRPGLDAVEFAILYALYELSLVMATFTSRRSARAGRRRRRSAAKTTTRTSACCSISAAAAGAVPSRRSTSALALLMGGGLVLFGIGGDTSGGLFDAFSGGGGGGSGDPLTKQIEARREAPAGQPEGRAGVGGARAGALPAASAGEATTRRPRPTRPRASSELAAAEDRRGTATSR